MSRTAHHESMKTSRGFGVGGRKRIFFTTHYPLSTNHYFHRSFHEPSGSPTKNENLTWFGFDVSYAERKGFLLH